MPAPEKTAEQDALSADSHGRAMQNKIAPQLQHSAPNDGAQQKYLHVVILGCGARFNDDFLFCIHKITGNSIQVEQKSSRGDLKQYRADNSVFQRFRHSYQAL